MSIIGSNILAGASGQGGGYTIENSLRFRNSATSYLSRTHTGTPTNAKKGTLSLWLKRGVLGAGTGNSQYLIESGTGASNNTHFNMHISTSDNIKLGQYSWPGFTTTAVFRDPSAWYHFVLSYDSTLASNNVILYQNGVQIGITSVTQNTLWAILNTGQAINIGRHTSVGRTFDGYLTEINLIDGQALDPSSFGEYNEDTGVWQPVAYAGSYGTNGFYLPFSDATNTTTLVADSSGNGNDWTPNNISLTSGVTYDSMTDTPTIYADGGNYAVLNPLQSTGQTASFFVDNANLDLSVTTNAGYRNVSGTFDPQGLKGYFEMTISTGSPNFGCGFIPFSRTNPSNTDYTVVYASTGPVRLDQAGSVLNGPTTVRSGYLGAFSSGDVLSVAFDFTDGNKDVWFAKNGTWGTSASGVGEPSSGANPVITSSIIDTPPRFWFGVNTGAGLQTNSFNFGQRPFAYTPPTGFLPMHTGNLPDSTIENGAEYMAATLFNVTSGANTIVNTVNGVGFQPDLIWTKSTSNTQSHYLVDSVRGGSALLRPDATNQESTYSSPPWVTSFNSDGYSSSTDSMISTGYTYVGWQWKAGTAFSNDAGTNGATLASVGSVNQDAGLSIVTYTANGTAAQTIGHGLGVAPSMIITKVRNNASGNFGVYHKSIGNTGALFLNVTNGTGTNAVYWNNTSPTSSVFSVGSNNTDTNWNTYNFVAYCFAEVPGYSKFGSYTGNGSPDGPFVYLGFRPKFVLVKRTDSGSNWFIWDSSRDTYNTVLRELYPDDPAAEYTRTGSSDSLDFTSNGFKIRFSATYADRNASGGKYIYMAFAENPFKNSLAR